MDDALRTAGLIAQPVVNVGPPRVSAENGFRPDVAYHFTGVVAAADGRDQCMSRTTPML